MALLAPTRTLPVAALLLASLSPGAQAARGPGPALRIPLDSAGYLPPPAHLLTPGGTTFTVNFVDPTHLLVTFNSRGLIQRDPNDPPGDQDRSITALLLDLPSGNILARTLWHMHDHGQYLWPLANGRFLVRIRGELSILAPLAHHESGDTFQLQPYLTTNKVIGFIAVSPEADLLTVETRPPRPLPQANAAANAAALNAVNMGNGPVTRPVLQDAQTDDPPDDDVTIVFYRLHLSTGSGDPGAILPPPVHAGAVRFNMLLDPALTSEGYIEAPRESTNMWLFDFYTYSGTKYELSPVPSSCAPAAHFISRSQFIGFSCHGGSDRNQLGGFNMKGEQLWQQSLPSGVPQGYIARAPQAGRFALSRLLMAFPANDSGFVTPDDNAAQEITVTQMATGENLLKLQTTPVQRSGQNFDLSPDGLSFAVLRDSNIEIYKLPPLTAKDQAAITLARSQEPPPESGPVRLNHGPERAAVAVPAIDPNAPNAPLRVKTEQEVDQLQIGAPAPAAAPAETVGDNPRRTPPTLYNPGESPTQR